MDGFLGRQEHAGAPAPAGIHALWTCTDSTRHSLAPFTPALCPLLCVLHCPPEKSSIPGVRALRLVRRDPETSLSVQSRPWPMTRQKCLRIVRAGGHLFHSVLSVFAGIVLRSMRPSWPMERVGARPHSRSPARQRTRNTGRSIVFPRLEKESVSCRQRKRRDTPLSVCDDASSHRTGNVLCKDVGVWS